MDHTVPYCMKTSEKACALLRGSQMFILLKHANFFTLVSNMYIFVKQASFLATIDNIRYTADLLFKLLNKEWRRGCCSVGRAVTSDTAGPQFESSYCIEKTQLEKKRPGMAPF